MIFRFKVTNAVGSIGLTVLLHASVDPVHIRDLHATMLHLLGIHHDQLTYRYQGLDTKLTGVQEARVVKEILS